MEIDIEINSFESVLLAMSFIQLFITKIRASKHIVAFILCLIVDIIFCIILHATFNKYKSFLDSRQTTIDILSLCIVRTIIIPVFIFSASKYGKSDYHLNNPNFLLNFRIQQKGKYSLVENEEISEDKRAENMAALSRKIFIGLIYAFYTFFQIFVGVKCVILNFESSGTILLFQQIGMVGLVIVLTFELYFSREIISFFTQVIASASGNCCDACEAMIAGPSFQCDQCCFDVCKICSEKQAETLEGVIRNDKGIIKFSEFSNLVYLKKLLFFVRPHILVVFSALSFLLLSSGASILLPNFEGTILDKVIKIDFSGFHKYIVLYIVANILYGLFNSIQSYCFNYIGAQLLYDIQVSLLKNVLQQDIAFFDGIPSGVIVSRVCYQVENMIAPVNMVLSTFLSSVVLVFGGLFMCLYTSWRLSVLAFTTIGPITLIYREYANVVRSINYQMWNDLSLADNVISESLHLIRSLRAFTKETNQEKKYLKARKEALKKDILRNTYEAATTLVDHYMEKVISILILWYGGNLVMENSTILSIGSLITFQLYWSMIRTNYNIITENASSFTKAAGAASNTLQLLSCKPSIDPTKGEECTKIESLEIKNVNYFYQMEPSQKVLTDFSLQIQKGQVVALVGKSGCGKSTIINLMLRFYDPKSGGILLNGKDLTLYNPKSYRSHIAVVSQDTQLVNGTILDNITMSKNTDDYTMDDVIEAAKKANAHEFIEKYEDGYQMNVGENGGRLSGGQKQRIALARAFLKKPALLFLDEATSALDAESESVVQDGIDKLIAESNCIVIVVAHRLSTIAGADKIVVVDKGSVVESGSHLELMAQGGLYASLVEKQTKKYRNLISEDE